MACIIGTLRVTVSRRRSSCKSCWLAMATNLLVGKGLILLIRQVDGSDEIVCKRR